MTVIVNLTNEQKQFLRETNDAQAQLIANAAQPDAISPSQFVFVAAFDGTNNDQNEETVPRGELTTSIVQLRNQITAARELNIFRHWYNRIRPHQALGISIQDGAARLYLTPAEAWRRATGNEHEVWFEGWNGILRGYACRM